MKHSWRVLLNATLILVVVWVFGKDSTFAQPTSTGVSQGVKRALLIGINKYRAVPKLQGSLNDIETMRQILISRWGFSDNNIKLLTDEAATREGILTALTHFVDDAGPNDTLYFHYSGHGSQVKDLNGDEDDGLDETLVPQDGRSGDVRDIIDDELDAIFGPLKTRNAMIVLDSCHSGTATRSLDIRTRSVPRDTRIELYRQQSLTTRAVVPVVSSRFVLMTGAASHQEALDGPVEGRYHGFFTYALSKSLSSSPLSASPKDVFEGVEREMKRIQTHFGRTSMPEPQLEAPPELLGRTLLGSGTGESQSVNNESSARRMWLETKSADPGKLALVNGLIFGASPGSMWAIYPPGETKFLPGHAVSVATVVEITGNDAVAKLISSPGKVQDGARAIAFMPAPIREKIPVYLDIPSDRRKQMEDILVKNIPYLELVGAERSPRFIIDSQGNSIRLLSADGLQVVGSFSGETDSWAAGLALVVSRSAHATELLTLDNPSSQLKVTVKVATSTRSGKPTVNSRGIAVVAATSQPARYRIRKSGKPRTTENSLQFEVSVNADVYLTIVDVDSEGGVNLLFPHSYQNPRFLPDGRIQSGKPVLIPDSIKKGNLAGFYWDYSPPTGTDTVRVFTSTDLETAQMIRQKISDLQGSKKVRSSTRSVAENLGSIREGLLKLATRGIITVPDSTSHVPTQPQVEEPFAPAAAPATETSPSLTGQNPLPPTVQVIPVGTTPDWAAASISIQVEN